MAGTVHEVENHALLAEVEREAANAAQELVEAARLHRRGAFISRRSAASI